ncbi:MAG TPA: hypothetical protein VF277_09790, partial [Steroidobacteraceae bacterium]
LWTFLLLAGCATTDPAAVHDYLDEQTAATVTVGGTGTVFGRARTEYAINARDYFTVIPVDVNRGGTHVLYFYCYQWSTIDRPNASDRASGFEIVADGRQIPLTPASASLRTLGFGQYPVEPPALNALPLVAVTTREVLSFLAQAKEVSVVATRNGLSERYELWTDQRSAVEAFLQEVPAVR